MSVPNQAPANPNPDPNPQPQNPNPPQPNNPQQTPNNQPRQPQTQYVDFGTGGIVPQPSPQGVNSGQQGQNTPTQQGIDFQTQNPLPSDQNQQNNQQANQNNQAGDNPNFPKTQEELNKVIQARLNQQAGQYKSQIDALKEDIAKLQGKTDNQNNQQAQKKDDKAGDNQSSSGNDDIQRMRQQIEELNQKMQQKDQQAKESHLRSTVINEAAKKNFADPSDVFYLLDRTKVTIEEKDGSFAVSGLEQYLTDLANSKPYLIRTTPVPNTGATNPSRNANGNVQQRTDSDRRSEYFGGGNSPMWNRENGGVVFGPRQFGE